MELNNSITCLSNLSSTVTCTYNTIYLSLPVTVSLTLRMLTYLYLLLNARSSSFECSLISPYCYIRSLLSISPLSYKCSLIYPCCCLSYAHSCLYHQLPLNARLSILVTLSPTHALIYITLFLSMLT